MSRVTFGLYVHLPFCHRRCSYCAFAISTDQTQQDRYHQAILREISDCTFQGAPVDSIYFGGGTPSRTPPFLLCELVERLEELFEVSPSAEISIEANPEDITEDVVRGWLDGSGVTRISVGVQSFHDAELYPLGRGHAGATARHAVQIAVNSGARVSLDLIAGLPNQTPTSFAESLSLALESGVGHLSLYMLDLEPGSALERQVQSGSVSLPDDETTAGMYLTAIDTAQRAGFHQYEISNFARTGEECHHNLKYWNREPYVGFGLGAHSFFADQRWANTRDLDEYVRCGGDGTSPIAFCETLDATERAREALLLGLRQANGLRYSELLQLRGEEALEWAARGRTEGWLHRNGDRVAFTGSGFLLSNEYISQLF